MLPGGIFSQDCQLNQARPNRRNCWATTPHATRAIRSGIKKQVWGGKSTHRAGLRVKLANEYHGRLNLNFFKRPGCLAYAADREKSDVIELTALLLEAIEQVRLR